jgi:hypothetical protein
MRERNPPERMKPSVELKKKYGQRNAATKSTGAVIGRVFRNQYQKKPIRTIALSFFL